MAENTSSCFRCKSVSTLGRTIKNSSVSQVQQCVSVYTWRYHSSPCSREAGIQGQQRASTKLKPPTLLYIKRPDVTSNELLKSLHARASAGREWPRECCQGQWQKALVARIPAQSQSVERCRICAGPDMLHRAPKACPRPSAAPQAPARQAMRFLSVPGHAATLQLRQVVSKRALQTGRVRRRLRGTGT